MMQQSNRALRQASTQVPLTEEPLGRFAPTAAQRHVIEFNRRFGLGNGALRKYGALLLANLREGPIDYDYYGLTLRLYPTLYASARHMLLTPGWSESKERAFIEAHLPPNGVFFDIGANAGFYTFFVAGRRPKCTVVAFEPVHEFAAIMEYNIRSNRLERVAVEEVALADREGITDINRETQSIVFGSEKVSVRTTTLLEAMRSRGICKIDCMKIDVEGVEDRVLMPFFRSAAKPLWPKAMIIEHACSSYWNENCLGFAKANGYREQWQSKLNTALVLNPD